MGPQHHCCGVIGSCTELEQGRGLQWGRNITVAECLGSKALAKSSWRFNGAATSLLRSVVLGESGFWQTQKGFNGAATSLLRSDAMSCRSLTHVFKLQWGRNITVAECYMPSAENADAVIASMGPQHHCCGVKRKSRHTG